MPATFEDLKRGLLAKGIVLNRTVTVIDVQWSAKHAAIDLIRCWAASHAIFYRAPTEYAVVADAQVVFNASEFYDQMR